MAEEIVMLPPDAVKVPDNVALVATTTLPNASDVGLALTCSGATPVPASVIKVGVFEASLLTEICPETLPVVVGANFAV